MKRVIYGLMAMSPVLALAQTPGGTITGLQTIITQFRGLLNTIIPVLIALAVVVFFWGLVKYIKSTGDEKTRADGRHMMLWSIIAIIIMLSLFGIITWIQNAVGLSGTASSYTTPPTI